jgi:hypothetical protein
VDGFVDVLFILFSYLYPRFLKDCIQVPKITCHLPKTPPVAK